MHVPLVLDNRRKGRSVGPLITADNQQRPSRIVDRQAAKATALEALQAKHKLNLKNAVSDVQNEYCTAYEASTIYGVRQRTVKSRLAYALQFGVSYSLP